MQLVKEEEPQQRPTNEVSEEGKIYEEPQQTSQDTEVRTVESTDTWMSDVDLSLKEKTPKRSNKGKSIAKKNPLDLQK